MGKLNFFSHINSFLISFDLAINLFDTFEIVAHLLIQVLGMHFLHFIFSIGTLFLPLPSSTAGSGIFIHDGF